MDYSTLHIKAPHEIHIAAKVIAAKRQTSMNQYIVDLIAADMAGNNLTPVVMKQGIDLYRQSTPKQKNVLVKAAKVVEEVGRTVEINIPDTRLGNGICKVHGTPLDHRGRCLQKGCKYA